MTTISISLPDAMLAFVDERVGQDGHATRSDYVCDLIRRDQDRQQLRKLLREGAESPVTVRADDAWFAGLRTRISVERYE